jgi:hypothetical protein
VGAVPRTSVNETPPLSCLTKPPDTVGEPISPLQSCGFCRGGFKAWMPSNRRRARRHFSASEFANSIPPFFATTLFSHNPTRSAYIAGLGLLTAFRVRYIRFPLSWRLRALILGIGKAARKPVNITLSGQNGLTGGMLSPMKGARKTPWMRKHGQHRLCWLSQKCGLADGV